MPTEVACIADFTYKLFSEKQSVGHKLASAYRAALFRHLYQREQDCSTQRLPTPSATWKEKDFCTVTGVIQAALWLIYTFRFICE